MQNSLLQLQGALQNWSHEEFGLVQQQLKKLRRHLESVHATYLLSSSTREEENLIQRISELLASEEVIMRQRLRIQWLNEGDLNTSFFPSKST